MNLAAPEPKHVVWMNSVGPKAMLYILDIEKQECRPVKCIEPYKDATLCFGEMLQMNYALGWQPGTDMSRHVRSICKIMNIPIHNEYEQ